jgi:hypothetical protein
MIRDHPTLKGLAAAATAAAMTSGALPQPAPATLHGAPPIIRQFQDWLLVCDNVRVCRAQPTSASGSLMVRRDPGAAGRLVVILDGQDPSPESSVPEPGSVRIDGAPLAGVTWRLNQAEESASLEGEPALRFVRALADARTLAYRGGSEMLEVPLTGMKAALLAVDEAQGRLETATAFTRPGGRPLSAVPAPITLPILSVWPAPSPSPLPAGFTARLRRASAQILAANECSAERAEIDESYPLTTTEAIAILFCGQGNVSTSFVLVRASRSGRMQVRQIVLPPVPVRPEEAGYEQRVYSDVEWDPATRSVESSGHSCAGTCGERSRWVFIAGDFVLASHFFYTGGGAEVLDVYRTSVRVRHARRASR